MRLIVTVILPIGMIFFDRGSRGLVVLEEVLGRLYHRRIALGSCLRPGGSPSVREYSIPERS